MNAKNTSVNLQHQELKKVLFISIINTAIYLIIVEFTQIQPFIFPASIA